MLLNSVSAEDHTPVHDQHSMLLDRGNKHCVCRGSVGQICLSSHCRKHLGGAQPPEAIAEVFEEVLRQAS